MQQKYNTQSSSKRKCTYPLYSKLDLRFSACYLCLNLLRQPYFTLYTTFMPQPTSLLWHGTTVKAVLHSTDLPIFVIRTSTVKRAYVNHKLSKSPHHMSESLSRISIQNKFSIIFLLNNLFNNFVCFLSSLQGGGGGGVKKNLQICNQQIR